MGWVKTVPESGEFSIEKLREKFKNKHEKLPMVQITKVSNYYNIDNWKDVLRPQTVERSVCVFNKINKMYEICSSGTQNIQQ